MRIKKIAPVTPANGNISNQYGTSQTDTYSQEFQNEHNVIVSSTEPTTSERVWFKQGKNLFDKSYIRSEYGFNYQGQEIIATGQFVGLKYIQVKPNTKYILSCVNSSNNRVVICEYNSSKTFIQRDIELNTNKVAITTTANTYYVRCSGMLTDLNDMQFELGDTRTTYEAYITPTINVDDREIYSKDSTEIVDLTSQIVMETGFSIKSGYVRKVGKVVYVNLCVTGSFTTSDQLILKLPLNPAESLNGGCFMSNSELNTTDVGYMFIAKSTGKISTRGASNFGFAKYNFTYFTD